MTARLLIPTAILAGLVVIALTVIAVLATGQPVGLFTRDIRILGIEAGVEFPPYVGALSILNNLVWAMAGALALCAAALVPARRLWASVLGLLLLVLAADDAYMVHESVAPELGVPEQAIYVLYAAVGAWLVVYSVRHHRDDSTLALVVGGGFLAISSAVDLTFSGQYLAEDGAKLMGALVLLTVPMMTLAPAAPLHDEPGARLGARPRGPLPPGDPDAGKGAAPGSAVEGDRMS